MDDLRQFFQDVVTDQLRQIEELMPSIGSGRLDEVESLRRLAHGLKGSGSTYGYPHVSEAAAAVEAATGDGLLATAGRLAQALREVAHTGPRLRLLVVDDDPLIARILRAHLESVERQVVTVDTLAAARVEIHERVPDLVVLDLFLPDGDGRSLLDEIRHHEATSAVPVVIISASADANDPDLTALGADVVIGKPFDPADAARRSIALLEDVGTRTKRNGRGALTSSYRSLLTRGVPIAVASIVPETHGPGGRRTDGPDATIALPVQEAVLEVVGTSATLGSWDGSDITLVSDRSPEELRGLLDRSRLRLRNAPHPHQDGALVSFSAAIVADDGGRGLHDAHARAHRFALDFNRDGGDRVAIHSTQTSNRRVLLAEDDTLTAALIIHRLEREGFEVVHHADGGSAIESIEDNSFGMVLLDVQIPGVDGFEVLRRVRALDRLAEVPVVMLTAVGSERDVVRGLELGADDYILKPFSPTELTARLKRFTRH
jgi:DNA-binding response OmpR family regulator